MTSSPPYYLSEIVDTLGPPWKSSDDELLPYHPSASHIPPDYRDGWNRCYIAWNRRSASVAAPAGWKPYQVKAGLSGLPVHGTVVLLWELQDYWEDEMHIVRGEVHMGEVREEAGSRFLVDFMDTAHGGITHWMPLPAAPQPSTGAAE
jgi:hypothetical protein